MENLKRLISGNERFCMGEPKKVVGTGQERSAAHANGQSPFAVILGCSDSRVPPELVFDQDIGALFVVRVAGNIATASEVGSIEFAVQTFGTPLVVVLGHTQCGAVTAALAAMEHAASPGSSNLQVIIEQVMRSVREASANLPDAVDVSNAVRANVEATVSRLKVDSKVLGSASSDGDLLIVGAEYDLVTGRVEFFIPRTMFA